MYATLLEISCRCLYSNSVAQRMRVFHSESNIRCSPFIMLCTGCMEWTVLSESCYIKEQFYKNGHFPIIHL